MQSHYTGLTHEACQPLMRLHVFTCGYPYRYEKITLVHSIHVVPVVVDVTVRLSARTPLNVHKAVYLSCFRDLTEPIRYTRASIQGRTVRDPGSCLSRR